ncbi:MAG: hypothetical protein MZV64_71620 [Ignavibacteriales bacterium]|nr:hypothetical protein [Ignavibacteriales bacterium]
MPSHETKTVEVSIKVSATDGTLLSQRQKQTPDSGLDTGTRPRCAGELAPRSRKNSLP